MRGIVIYDNLKLDTLNLNLCNLIGHINIIDVMGIVVVTCP